MNETTAADAGDEILLTKAQILAADDLPYELVPVPEWGGKVRVRGLTAAERDAFESEMVQSRGKDVKINYVNIRAKLVARTIVDAKGERIFADAKDIQALGNKSGVAVDRVFPVASRLSGLSKTDVEELAGKSESDRVDESSSD